MMLYKFVATLICCVQIVNARSINVHNSKTVELDLQAALKQLDREIKQISHDISTSMNQFREDTNQVYIATSHTIAQHIEIQNQTVQAFKHKAEEQQVDIEDCTSLWEDGINNDVDQNTKLAQLWVKNYYIKHLPTWYDILRKTEHSQTEIDGYKLEAWLCDNEACFDDVLKKVELLSGYVNNDLLQIVEQELAEAVHDGKTIIRNWYKETDTLLVNIEQHTEDFKKCVEHKLDV